MFGVYGVQIEEEIVYVGSTIQDFAARWSKHKLDLRKGKHANSIMQRAWDKYGEAAFEFFPIELCNRDIVRKREGYWMGLLKPRYNIMKIVNGRTGFSDETKAKLSAARRGKVHSIAHSDNVSKTRTGRKASEETKEKQRKACTGSRKRGRLPVVCLDTGVIYPNILAAAKAIGRGAGSVWTSIHKNTRAAGLRFAFADSNTQIAS